MADQSALLRAFAEYARTISRHYDIGEVLYRLTDQVVEVLDVDGAGVSVAAADDRLLFVAATDQGVARVEDQQIELGDGPGQRAYRKGERVIATDLTIDERWPSYARVAREQGLRSVAGIPLIADDERIGALNLYCRRPYEWPSEELNVAQILADMTSGYIVNAQALSAQRQLATQLQHALDSRVVIEQAKGILAERHGMEPAAAFQIVRKHARANNARIHDIARGVVDGSLPL